MLTNSYADYQQFVTYGMKGAAVPATDRDRVESILVAKSRTADSYLAIAYGESNVPFSQWPETLTEAVCKLAAFEYIGMRGAQIEGPDDVILTRYKDAMAWLRDIAAKRAVIIGVTANAPPRAPSSAAVYSEDAPRI